MDASYQDKLQEIFQVLNIENIYAIYDPPIVFVCGGEVDVTKIPPISIRHRFIENCASNDPDLEKCLIQAEMFTDYLEHNIYSDLLTFEDDIANISSLVIIILESPGSIIELGIFCVRDATKKKLIVFAPEDKTEKRDSFIYLGPLTYLRQVNSDSVKIYPWEDNGVIEREDLELIHVDVKDALEKANKSEKFDTGNSGHIAFLIHDIISIAQPVRIEEIYNTTKTIHNDVSESIIKRLIFLLVSVNLIGVREYSSSEYYYVLNKINKLKIGQTKDKKKFSRAEAKLSLREYSKQSDKPIERKRRKLLEKIISGEEE